MTEPVSKEITKPASLVDTLDQKSVTTRQILKKQITYTPGDSASSPSTGQGSLNYFLNRNVSLDVKETSEPIIDPLKIFELNHDNSLANNHNSSFNSFMNNNNYGNNNENNIEEFSLHRTNECENLNHDGLEYDSANMISLKTKENTLKRTNELENLSNII
jgi:hypothetical protein